MNKSSIIKELNRVLKKGKMNDNLKKAIQDTITALNKNNLDLAYELTSVKSLIVGDLKYKKHYFREDDDYNESVLGTSIYSILDGVHFSLAMKTGGMPSGMTMFTPFKAYQKGPAKIKHPILKLIESEKSKIRRGVL